ncbi:MAG TPA: TetR/AcrR family transcriptional regulator [Ktedonobacteraceae bacterium]|nr:TetR/AcrR family transcriptional regulator [Ktedonobacteraceae bacterium]
MEPITAPRSLKEKQRQEREALILQAAEEVLLEKGYHETSIDEIAARVGIAKGTVYLHFPSKEDLVIAIFEHEMQQLLQYIDSTMNSQLSAWGKIEAIFDVMHGGMMSKRMRLLFSISDSAGLKHLLVEKTGCLRETWDQLTVRLNSLFEEGKAEGAFDSTLPTMVMVSAFYSFLSPKSYARLTAEGQMSGEDIATYLKRIFLNGISAN